MDKLNEIITKQINRRIIDFITGEGKYIKNKETKVNFVFNEKEVQEKINNFTLTKEIVIDLLRSITIPDYKMLNILMSMELGRMIGGLDDRWEWNDKTYFEKYNLNTLYAIYLKLKNKI